MTKASTQVIAKAAAIVAGLGLVLSAFAVALPASAQTTTTTTTTTSSATFTRDLTIGSTGADVTALQAWLISKGFSVPAGATGYFGTQTQAAVAAYQAANGITPAAGYFGPITRAKVNAGGSVTVPGGDDDDDDDSDGDLSGGEADLTDYELNDGESSAAEGEEDVELATAEFDVEDGDIRLERLEFDVQAESVAAGDSTKPWDYFENLYVSINGEEVADLDVSDRDEWDEEEDDDEHDASSADWYRVSFDDLDTIVDEGDAAEIMISADIVGNIDSDDLDSQQFTFSIGDEGIRGRDSEGIDQYVGDDTETVTDFDFDEEETGDLDINTSSDDPDNMTLISDEDDESDEYTVFVFELENNDDVDVLVTDLTIDVATTGMSISNLLEDAWLVVDGEEYDGDINAVGLSVGTIDFDDVDFVIGGDETVNVELVVTLAEDAAGSVDFSIDDADVDAESDEDGDESDVSGSASSETHTVALTGVSVAGVSTDSDQNDAGTIGTFEITFEVTAEGEDDVYIWDLADDNDAGIASTTGEGVLYNIYQGSTQASATTTDSAILTSGAEHVTATGGFYWKIEAGETEEFTLTVSLDPAAGLTAQYYIELDEITFDDNDDDVSDDTDYEVPDESEFQTSAETLAA